MLVNIIQNTISSFISAGISVITTNLKMWLGFETSETLGRELVSNGDFSDGTTLGWTFVNLTADISNNTLKLTSTTSADNRAFYNISTEVGKTYQMSADVKSGASNSISGIGGIGTTNPAEFQDGANADSFTTLKFVFTAVLTTTQIRFLNSKSGVWGGLGSIAEFDNVSVKELTQITPDKSGNNNVGELFTGKALDFDGITEEVDVSGFQMSGAIATFAFWIYPRDTTYQFIMDNKLASGNTDRTIIALFQSGTDSQKFGFFNSGFKQFGTPIQNQWQRVVFRVNATTVECYVDGVKSGSTENLVSSINLSATVISNIASKSGSSSASNLDGSLSDFQIYNAYWSTDDIAFDYANPNKLAIDNPSTSLSVTNLKAYWAMSEGDGLVAYDSGTNLEEEEVQNGTFNLGSEEVTDGDFPLPNVNWTKGTKWTIDNNAARLVSNNSTGSGLEQSLVFEIGKTYNLIFDATVIQGSAKVEGASGSTLLVIDETKTYNFTFIADRTNLYFNRDAYNSDVTISNVSVKEVPNWTLGDGWSVGDNNKITRTAQSITTSAAQDNISFVSGKSYSITYTLDVSAGSFLIRLGTPGVLDTPARSVSDTYTEVITATSNHTKLNLRALGGTFAGSISNVSVREVTASDHGGIINGADYVDAQPRIPQLGMMNWAKSTPVADEITLIPNPTIPTQDILGNAVRDRLNSFNLDGSGYAEVAEVVGLDVTDFSIEAWVKFDYKNSGSTTNVIYVNGGVSTSVDTFALTTDEDNKVRFIVGGVTLYSTTVFSNNNWVYIAGTRESGALKLYINGNKTPEATGTGNAVVNNTLDLLVGRDTQTNRFYKERISDVRLYGAALSSDEVENNYNAGLSAHTN